MNKETSRAENFSLTKLLNPNVLTTIGSGGGIGLGLASLAAAGGATVTAGISAFVTLFSIAFYIAYKTFRHILEIKMRIVS